MARIRSVKPDLRTSTVVASWPREIRYAWVLLWGYLDDLGRGLDVPKGIAGDLFPRDDDVTPKLMDRWLTVMAAASRDKPGPLCRYEVGGIRYLHAVNWSEHQRVQRPTPSRLPPCPLHELPPSDSRNDSTKAPEPLGNSHGPDATRAFGDGDGDGDGVRPAAGAAPAADPPSAALVAVPTPPPDTAQTLIGEWIDHCQKKPPGNVIGQVGRQLKAMLGEGIDPDDVRRGLAAWHTKGLHPSTLPSVVNEVMNAPNGRTARPSTTDSRVAQALAAAAEVQAHLDRTQRKEIAS